MIFCFKSFTNIWWTSKTWLTTISPNIHLYYLILDTSNHHQLHLIHFMHINNVTIVIRILCYIWYFSWTPLTWWYDDVLRYANMLQFLVDHFVDLGIGICGNECHHDHGWSSSYSLSSMGSYIISHGYRLSLARIFVINIHPKGLTYSQLQFGNVAIGIRFGLLVLLKVQHENLSHF